jgi:hypothetical protein
MRESILSKSSATLTRKDPGVALTTLGMISSREEPIMYFSTPQQSNYHQYLKSLEWRNKKREWIDSGRPLECWACGDEYPHNGRGFNFHHRTYKNLGNEDLNDLVLLCQADHRMLEEQFKEHRKMSKISLESWTWIYISLTRLECGLPAIKNSNIKRYMGAFNE